MVFIKQIRMKNYCGYIDTTFNFYSNGKRIPMSVFYGPNGIGKCCLGTTNIITSSGQFQIADLFCDKKLSPDTWYKTDLEIFTGSKLSNVKYIYYSGKHKTVKTVCFSGLSIEGSYDRHKILSLVNDNIDFKLQRDIKPGDFVCIKRNSIFPEKCQISSGESGLLGYLISEGACSKDAIKFYNSDFDVLDHFKKLYYQVFGINKDCIFYKSSPDCAQINISSSQRKHLYSIGLTVAKSGEKTVPISVLQGTKEVIQMFLRTYFEGDGGIESKKICTIGCASKSKQLLEQIQILLLRLGIVSILRKKYTKKLSYTNKSYTSYNITISADNVIKFAEEIGFVSTKKKNDLNAILIKLKRKNRNPNKDIIPVPLVKSLVVNIKNVINNAGIKFKRKDYKKSKTGLHCLQPNYLSTVKTGISRDKIRSCIKTVNNALTKLSVLTEIKEPDWLSDNYFYDKIKTVEYGYDDLYDICVEEDHYYWSNGFISHNSTILNAVRLLVSAKEYKGRDMDLILRSLVHSDEYNPDLSAFDPPKEEMYIEGTFDIDGEDKKVILCAKYWEEFYVGTRPDPSVINDSTKCVVLIRPHGSFIEDQNNQEWIITFFYGGFIRNDLEGLDKKIVLFVDADNSMNMKKFQVPESRLEQFIEIAEAIYGYPCLLAARVVSGSGDKAIAFYSDFIINKRNGKTKIHFKRMSDGEKKIATLLRILCNPAEIDEPNIILIDNVCMHIYFKRHSKLVDILLKMFPEKQFFVTTHSAALIQHVMERNADNNEPSWLFDIEMYKPEEAITI